MTVSVLITTYHLARREALASVVRAWHSEPVEQVWVLNGGERWESPEPAGLDRFALFNMPVDLGNGMDYAFAALTSGDHIILADDDFLPAPGLVEDFNTHRDGADILGIIGRCFHGPRYRGDTTFHRANSVEALTPVDFVGVCCYAGREMFGFDTRGMHRNCDDLWWQMRVHPMASKAVIPTDKYRNLPTCSGPSSMFSDKALWDARQSFYEEHYRAGHYYGVAGPASKTD